MSQMSSVQALPSSQSAGDEQPPPEPVVDVVMPPVPPVPAPPVETLLLVAGTPPLPPTPLLEPPEPLIKPRSTVLRSSQPPTDAASAEVARTRVERKRVVREIR